jgi:hypothetical protein
LPLAMLSWFHIFMKHDQTIFAKSTELLAGTPAGKVDPRKMLTV